MIWMTGLMVAGVVLADDAKTNAPLPLASAVTNVAVTNVVAKLAMATNGPVATPSLLVASPDPQVGKVLMGLATYLQAAKTFRCSVSFRINSEMEGMKQEISAVYALAAERTNRLSLRYVKGMTGNTVVCNGKKLIIYAPGLNRFEERDAPKSFEQLAEGVGPMAGNMLFVDNLLREDIYAAIMEGVMSVTYAGKELVEGMDCDHIKFVQDQFDWELWVSSGEKPVVVQVLSDMSKSFAAVTGEAASLPKGMKMTVLNQFSNWVVDGAIPVDTFDFDPPAGARKADSLFEGEDEDAVEKPAMPVLGEKK